jgi:DNA replication protein DnaC
VSDGAVPAAGCGRCGDTGFVHETIAGREYARRCACARGGAAAGPADPLDAIPFALRHCTLGNFEPRTDALRSAYARALEYCGRYARIGREQGLGLVFWGGRGTGKTHLAAAVMAELAANEGVRGVFWHFGALLSAIGRSYDQGTRVADLRPLDTVLGAELLVLDDLGARKMTDWAADTLFDVLNSRYCARRPTVVTTPFEDVDREVALEADSRRREEFLIERVGQRVRSRLLEMCVFVPMQDTRERSAGRRPTGPSTLGAMRRAEKG